MITFGLRKRKQKYKLQTSCDAIIEATTKALNLQRLQEDDGYNI